MALHIAPTRRGAREAGRVARWRTTWRGPGAAADKGGSAADGAAHRADQERSAVAAVAADVEDAAGRAAHVGRAVGGAEDNNREGSAGSGCRAWCEAAGQNCVSLRDSGRQCLARCIAFGGKRSGFVPSGVPSFADKSSDSKCQDGLDTDPILIGRPNASMGVYRFSPCLQFFGRSLVVITPLRLTYKMPWHHLDSNAV